MWLIDKLLKREGDNEPMNLPYYLKGHNGILCEICFSLFSLDSPIDILRVRENLN